MKKLRVIGTTAAAALLAVTGLAAPASAEVVRVVDGDDSAAEVDLLRVRLSHGDKQVRVRMVHDDLLRLGQRAGQSVSVFIDTDPEDAGPEFRFVSGLSSGTDYALLRVKGWASEGRRVDCNYRFTINWRDDVTVLKMGRGCLGKPETVAVAVKAEQITVKQKRFVDWLGKRRQLTTAVAQG